MLNDSVILITGGLGLLGRAISETVEAQGGVPVLTSRDQEKVIAFNREAEKAGQKKRAYQLPAQDEKELTPFIENLLEQYPNIAGLVNNAYPAMPYRSVEETDWSYWSEAARIGLALPQSLSSILVEHQDKTDIGSIVNVASMYGLLAVDLSIYPPGHDPNPAYYGSMKAALIQLTRYHAVYWAERGIRVNSVSPGGLSNQQEEEFLNRYNATVPMGRMVTPEEVASTVCFLLSQNSSGMTGQNLVIDGGRTII